MADQVKLHGTWSSPFVYRVIWALKLKGVPYEYVEEDLFKKSPLLQQYNPVNKKIPVLVHGGKPVCESMIIVEYIDQTWPHNPLLSTDPYEKAMARFWVKFAEDEGSIIGSLFQVSGEEHEKAIKESLEMLKIVEEHGLGEKTFFGGDKIGIVDIAFGAFSHWLGVIEETLGLELLQPNAFPRLHAWTKNFKEVPVIKDNLPDRDKMLVQLKGIREMYLAPK